MYNTCMRIDVFFYFFIFTMIVSLDRYLCRHTYVHMTAYGQICTFILTATYISYIPAGDTLSLRGRDNTIFFQFMGSIY